MSTQPVSILASEVRMMKSTYTGKDYRILISLPYAGLKSDRIAWPFNKPLEKWPVVYLTDGNWYFGMVTYIVRPMGWLENTTDAIVVGIGYPEDQDPQEALYYSIERRFYDLSPSRDEGYEKYYGDKLKRPVQTGGASHFLKFIKHELIPVIEQDYQADPQKRILLGHSLGGNFTIFALLEEPDLFNTYIIGSPSLAFGDRFIFKQEESYAKQHKKFAATVHLWMGDIEETADNTDLSDFIHFEAVLENRKYKGLKLVRQLFPGLAHNEVIAPGFLAGLKMALKG
jgi:predicted alpha/beta superfamily hydrolase